MNRTHRLEETVSTCMHYKFRKGSFMPDQAHYMRSVDNDTRPACGTAIMTDPNAGTRGRSYLCSPGIHLQCHISLFLPMSKSKFECMVKCLHAFIKLDAPGKRVKVAAAGSLDVNCPLMDKDDMKLSLYESNILLQISTFNMESTKPKLYYHPV